MITLEQLATELNNLYPTSYSHFPDKQTNVFIVYSEVGEENFHADNKVISEGLLVDIDLYSVTKNLAAERELKDLFRRYEIPYDKGDTVFIQTESIYMTTFTIKLILKY